MFVQPIQKQITSKKIGLQLSFKELLLEGIKGRVHYEILTCNSRGSNPIGRDINFSKVSLCGPLSRSMSLRIRSDLAVYDR